MRFKLSPLPQCTTCCPSHRRIGWIPWQGEPQGPQQLTLRPPVRIDHSPYIYSPSKSYIRDGFDKERPNSGFSDLLPVCESIIDYSRPKLYMCNAFDKKSLYRTVRPQSASCPRRNVWSRKRYSGIFFKIRDSILSHVEQRRSDLGLWKA